MTQWKTSMMCATLLTLGPFTLFNIEAFGPFLMLALAMKAPCVDHGAFTPALSLKKHC